MGDSSFIFYILSSSTKKSTITSIREQVKQKTEEAPEPRVLALFNPLMCPCCKTQTMVIMEIFHKRGPPPYSRNKVLKMQNQRYRKGIEIYPKSPGWQRHAKSKNPRENINWSDVIEPK